MSEMQSVVKISLVIAGAVSLGSYEGGALSELLYTLEYLNGTDDSGNPRSSTRYVIDVITGGSAGSLTGAMVARVLLHDINRRDILKKCWVDKVDFKMLQDSQNKYPGALFKTDDVQDRLMKLYLQGRKPEHPDDKDDAFTMQVVQRASCAPDEGDALRLAFSVTNLAGVDYQIPYRNTELGEIKGQMQTYFSFFDEFEVDDDTLLDVDYWTRISNSAVASGTFPLAFTPKKLKKTLGDYPNAPPRINTYLGADPQDVEHYDGGMLRNEPLKKAMQLSSRADGGLINEDRIFILIDPNMNKSKQQTLFSHERNRSPDLITNAMRCVDAVCSEASNEDWKHINKVNRQLQWMRGIANDYAHFANALPDDALAGTCAASHAEALQILAEKARVVSASHPPDLTGRYYKDSIAHARSLFASAFDLLRDDRGSDELFRKAGEYLEDKLFCLLAASDLNRKSEINLWIIGADKKKVGGDPLFAMLGFFKHAVREYDYRVGRQNTRKILTTDIFKKELTDAFPREADDQYEPGRNPNYDTEDLGDLSGVDASIIPWKDKWTLKKLVAQELKHARKVRKKAGSWSVHGALTFILSRVVEGMLLWDGAKKGAAWTWGKVKGGISRLWRRIKGSD